MKLLVTGATGQVGRELVRQAAEQGHGVTAVSRSAKPENGSHSQANVRWVACDLSDPAAVGQLADKHPIDCCIHGAAVSNEAYARPDPLGAINSNVLATANLLETARVRNWRRMLLIGTGSVFQCRRALATPIREDETPVPQNIYSTTKFNAEMLMRMYRSEFDLSAATVRISWVYGPPVVADAPTRGPVPSFLLRAMRGIAIKEPGGDFAASFTFVGDVAAGLLAAIAAEQLNHDIYHLGPGRNFSAHDVADAVRAAVPAAKIELSAGTQPWTTYTAMRAPLVGERLFVDTGFALQYSLSQGIAAYADWMRANLRAWQQ